MSIVNTNSKYSSATLRNNLNSLLRTFPFINVQSVGNSILGCPIYIIKLGIGKNTVFYSASIHANEWITSLVLMKFVEDYCNAFSNNLSLENVSIKTLFNSTTIYIMPMVNPDGVDLVTGFLPTSSYGYQSAKQISDNFPNIPFSSGWKANIRGVDLKKYQPIIKKELIPC